jgi:hypothetical protein
MVHLNCPLCNQGLKSVNKGFLALKCQKIQPQKNEFTYLGEIETQIRLHNEISNMYIKWLKNKKIM